MSQDSHRLLEFGNFRIDATQRFLLDGNKEISLPPKVFETLFVLVENAGRVVEKDVLMKAVWAESFVEEGSLARNISILRKALGETADDQKYIQTIPKRGYRFVAPVKTVSVNGRVEAEGTGEDPAGVGDAVTPPPTASGTRSRRTVVLQPHHWLWIAAAVAAAALAMGAMRYANHAPKQVMHLNMSVAPADRLAGLICPILALSPDGSTVAFVATKDGVRRIFLRQLDQLEGRAVPGTEGAFCTPFFSPDGQWLAFFSEAKLKKVPLGGGAPITITPLGGVDGASWGADGSIVYATGAGGLWKVSSDGGVPQLITNLDTSKGETSHRWPQILPRGNAVLFTVAHGENPNDTHVVAQDFKTGRRMILAQGGTGPHFVSEGYVVYLRAGTLMALPFDADGLSVLGPPVPATENVMQTVQGAAEYSFSPSGSLVYVAGGDHDNDRTLVWVDRNGDAQPLSSLARAYEFFTLSFNNLRVIANLRGLRNTLWAYDTTRGTLSRFAYGISPVMSPDDKFVAYATRTGIVYRTADGTGSELQITSSQALQWPSSWSPDGRSIAFVVSHPDTGSDIAIVSTQGEHKITEWLQTSFNESAPTFSPDGRWIAYVSNESQRYEVYVRPYPGPDKNPSRPEG